MTPFPEGSRYPGFVFARGDDPAAVEQALREAARRLRFVLAPPLAPMAPTAPAVTTAAAASGR